jgi:hypothetical protein
MSSGISVVHASKSNDSGIQNHEANRRFSRCFLSLWLHDFQTPYCVGACRVESAICSVADRPSAAHVCQKSPARCLLWPASGLMLMRRLAARSSMDLVSAAYNKCCVRHGAASWGRRDISQRYVLPIAGCMKPGYHLLEVSVVVKRGSVEAKNATSYSCRE